MRTIVLRKIRKSPILTVTLGDTFVPLIFALPGIESIERTFI
jgi:hypothetical protein